MHLAALTDSRSFVTTWLEGFERALNGADGEAFGRLFREGGSWRDLLAFTGGIRQAHDRTAAVALFDEVMQPPGRHSLQQVDRIRAESTTRFGMDLTEVFFDFVTEIGEGVGIARLMPSENEPDVWEALTLLTTLQSLEKSTGRGVSISEAVRQDDRNWPVRRQAELEYANDDPAVLVVGAGQSGLSTAAALKAVGVDALVVDKWDRVGDTWRSRYQSLKLHSGLGINHLPFMPFPDFFPEYVPKDKVGSWFEAYADALELNVWTSTLFLGADHGETSRRWHARVERDGVVRNLYPRHIVMATGVSGAPHIPELAGLDRFRGLTIHSSAYVDGNAFEGRRVLVVGTGTSAHDVAEDLCQHGADVTMMQRSKTIIVSRDAAHTTLNGVYTSGLPTEVCDLIRLSSTYPMQRKWLPVLTAKIAEVDKDLLDGLKSAGFETHFGDGNMNIGYEYYRRGGGYYIDIGCSGLIVEGKIKVVQARDVAGITETGISLNDGSSAEFDVVVLATGYKGIQNAVRQYFGDEIADRVGPVWGLNAEAEFNNIACQTAQQGLWFMAGGFPESRIFSRYLALQIQAAEAGVRIHVAGRSGDL